MGDSIMIGCELLYSMENTISLQMTVLLYAFHSVPTLKLGLCRSFKFPKLMLKRKPREKNNCYVNQASFPIVTV